eukprot:225054_1
MADETVKVDTEILSESQPEIANENEELIANKNEDDVQIKSDEITNENEELIENNNEDDIIQSESNEPNEENINIENEEYDNQDKHINENIENVENMENTQNIQDNNDSLDEMNNNDFTEAEQKDNDIYPIEQNNNEIIPNIDTNSNDISENEDNICTDNQTNEDINMNKEDINHFENINNTQQNEHENIVLENDETNEILNESEEKIDEQNENIMDDQEIIQSTFDEEQNNICEPIESNKDTHLPYQETEEEIHDITQFDTKQNEIMEELNNEIIHEERDNYKVEIEKQHSIQNITKSEKSFKEIGIQTIILGSEIKLGSKTKKRIAEELGYYINVSNNSRERTHGSMSPIIASKQMKSSSQKIAKVINEHKAQLKVIFDRYSNGLTNKIKLDGLTRMLKDRNILKKISLVPEITKAFHKSSFTKATPDSLTFDEFLQCIIRLANDLLSRKKK